MKGSALRRGAGEPSSSPRPCRVHRGISFVAAGLVASAALVGGTAVSGAEPPDPPGPSVHSSDGRPGPLAAPVPRALLRRGTASDIEAYRVVPGLHYRHWRQTNARGTVDAYLLRANLEKRGLSLEYVGPDHVSERAPLTQLLHGDDAVAGVNADFFDISDTGAPLGVGVDDRRVLHGPRSGWTKGFSLADPARARVGDVPVRARVVRGPKLRITDVNTSHVGIDETGLYTARWGSSPGYAVTDGALPRNVRQVHIRRGRVVSNTRAVTTGAAVKGQLLLGRGAGADQLKQRLPVGKRVRIRVSAAGSPRVAVGGSEVLVTGGKVVTTDDGQLHPRTAVGFDSDTGRVLLLVVDGRSEASIGYTLVELALLMVELGAEEALNLDGGGSSTMGVTPPDGELTVANVPSDGQERPVPNGLGLVWSPPRG